MSFVSIEELVNFAGLASSFKIIFCFYFQSNLSIDFKMLEQL